MKTLKHLLSPPIFEGDPDRTGMARCVHAMTWVATVVMITYAIALQIVAPPLTARAIIGHHYQPYRLPCLYA